MVFVDENSAKRNVRLNGAWICAKETESFNVGLGRKRKCYCLASTDAKERRTEGSTDRPKLESLKNFIMKRPKTRSDIAHFSPAGEFNILRTGSFGFRSRIPINQMQREWMDALSEPSA